MIKTEDLKKVVEALNVLINESEKPKFEVGKWYKIKYQLGTAIINYKEKHNSYGFSYNSKWSNDFDVYGYEKPINYTLATPKEVEDALIKEAVKIGFKEGVKFKTCLGNIRTGLGKLEFLDYDNVLRFKNSRETGMRPNVFRDGKWATPIKTKTIDETVKDLSILSEYGIKDYLTQEKTALIETLNNL